MYKILLACNAGMSTSLLVSNMVKYAKEQGIEAEIKAVGVTEAEKIFEEWDIVMLGPQVRHVKNNFDKIVAGSIPVAIIDMRDYGLMNGKNVLLAGIDMIKQFKK